LKHLTTSDHAVEGFFKNQRLLSDAEYQILRAIRMTKSGRIRLKKYEQTMFSIRRRHNGSRNNSL
jgi:hypothetical protein